MTEARIYLKLPVPVLLFKWDTPRSKITKLLFGNISHFAKNIITAILLYYIKIRGNTIFVK